MGIQSNFGEYNRDIMDYIIGYTVYIYICYVLCMHSTSWFVLQDEG